MPDSLEHCGFGILNRPVFELKKGPKAWRLCSYHARVDGVTPFRYCRSLVNRSLTFARRGTEGSVHTPVESV